jgi:hypothetical protein
MNRPRESVLNLFDPLLAPHDNESADESDPEKENDAPRSELSMMRLLDVPSQSQIIPSKRRLIDIGDASVDNVLPGIQEEDEDEEESSGDSADDLLADPSTRHTRLNASRTPRTPFSELPLTREVTPPAKKQRHFRRPQLPAQGHPILKPDPPAAAPAKPTLSSIIETIHSSKRTFAEQNVVASPSSVFAAYMANAPRPPAENHPFLPPSFAALLAKPQPPVSVASSSYKPMHVMDVSVDQEVDDFSIDPSKWKIHGEESGVKEENAAEVEPMTFSERPKPEPSCKDLEGLFVLCHTRQRFDSP